jgi:ribosomal protein S18 acetylase RimI-like enzyme
VSESLIIRRADHHSIAIAQAIHRVQMAAYAQEAALLGVPSLPPQAVTIEQLRLSPDRFEAAYLGSLLVGALVSIEHPALGNMAINALVVDPDHQRQGIATALLLHALNRTSARSILVSTAAGNEPALALYRKHGFAEYRRWETGEPPLELLALRLERNSSAE